MDLWSSFCGACSSVCGGIASVVGGGVSALGSAISSALSIGSIIGSIIKVVDTIGRALGIWGEKETTDEMGDRALQAQEAGIRPEDYKTYEAYLKEIRGLELKPEKSKKYTAAEKVMAGMGVCYWGLDGKYGKGSGDLLTHIVKDHEFFNEKRLGVYLDGVCSVADVARYFSGKLDPDDNARVRNDLMGVEKQMNPDKSDADIYRDLNARKSN